MPGKVRLIILNVGWYVPTELRDHDFSLPPEVSASWAFLIESE
jgi:hypothetical protein